MSIAEPHRYLSELKQQLKTSIPATLSFLISIIPGLITIRFVGNIGDHELAAAALASSIFNVTGFSFSVGLSTAVRTLAGRARGEGTKRSAMDFNKRQQQKQQLESLDCSPLLFSSMDGVNKGEYTSIKGTSPNKVCKEDSTRHLLMVYLVRGLFIQLVITIPIGLYWVHGVKTLLLALGQGEVVSQMSQEYLRILTPGLWAYSVNFTLTAWLQSVELAAVPACAAFFGLIAHIPFNIFFIYTLNLGYKGSAVATVMLQTVQPLLQYLYLWHTDHGRCCLSHQLNDIPNGKNGQSSRAPFTMLVKEAVCSWEGVMQYLSLALPGIIAVSEWWASEIAILLSGLLQYPYPSDISLDGMSIYQSINIFCGMFPFGASIGGSTRVSNLLGSNDPVGAQRAAHVSIAMAGVSSVTIGMVLYFTPHTTFPSFFTPNQDVIMETSRTISLLSMYVIFDGLQCALNGVIQGCGRQCITVPIVLVAYWCVGLPVGYYIAFVKNHGGEEQGQAEDEWCDGGYFCGIVGLVVGMTLGTFVHMMLLGFTVGCTTDWDAESKKAQNRLSPEMPLSPMLTRRMSL